MAKNPEKRKIRFKHIFPEDYNPSHVNGALGGVGPKGDIIINFFYERPALPYDLINELNEKGQIGAVIEEKPENLGNFHVRYITSGITLSYKDAIGIRDFISSVIEQAENIERQKND